MQATQPASLRHCVACGSKLAGLLLCMLDYVAMETILHAQDQFDAMEKTIHVWALGISHSSYLLHPLSYNSIMCSWHALPTVFVTWDLPTSQGTRTEMSRQELAATAKRAQDHASVQPTTHACVANCKQSLYFMYTLCRQQPQRSIKHCDK